MSIMKKVVERIWMAPWPQLLSVTTPGQFDLIINIGDHPRDSFSGLVHGASRIHTWVPAGRGNSSDYCSFFAVGKLLENWRGKRILIYTDELMVLPIQVWAWILSEGLQESAFEAAPECRENCMARWWDQDQMQELPENLVEFLVAARDSPEANIEEILNSLTKWSKDSTQKKDPEGEVATEGESQEVEEEEELVDQGPQNYFWNHVHPFGSSTGLVSSPLNLTELVHGRAHSQSRMAMAAILKLNYEPRKGERLEITGPWSPESVSCSEEEWEAEFALAESKHKTHEHGHE